MLEGLKPKFDRRNRCKVGETIRELGPEDGMLLTRYLADTDTWSANGLSTALKSRGISLAVTTIIRHRNGECPC